MADNNVTNDTNDSDDNDDNSINEIAEQIGKIRTSAVDFLHDMSASTADFETQKRPLYNNMIGILTQSIVAMHNLCVSEGLIPDEPLVLENVLKDEPVNDDKRDENK